MRPNANDDLHAEAVALRLQGKSYNEIKDILGVSKSTLSNWLRDVALTDEQRRAIERGARFNRSQTRRALRLRRNEEIMGIARADITELSERELFIRRDCGVLGRGSKSKPWRNCQASFINSDPDMVRFFLAWLRLLGIGNDRLTFRINIHENADVAAAVGYWAGVVGVPAESFNQTTLKRHNPKTVRHNVGDDYHGCLIIRVRRSNDLNLLIAGWCRGLAAAGRAARPGAGPVPEP